MKELIISNIGCDTDIDQYDNLFIGTPHKPASHEYIHIFKVQYFSEIFDQNIPVNVENCFEFFQKYIKHFDAEGLVK